MNQSSLTTMVSGGTTIAIFECPSFSCNKSECYSMYSSQNATWCPAESVCQLMRQMDMCYTVSCTASCADSCVNASQIDCNENCCNFTGCLNSSFASMMNMTTASGNATTMTPTSKPVTKTTTTGPVNNGNKCNKGVCTGPSCYTAFKTAPIQTCSSSQPHCQLMKETVDSSLKWTAGCISNCSAKTTCEASTPPPCHLECCNATSTSCLWLNGTMNVPSFATRGPSLHTELMTCLLGLLAFTLML
ncbi:keratin-associated protein 4-7 [Hippoglossus hippoglossus]|uniref:keratin-associated protein 4-7 n=1 Tax=Hippoglossus hippoglossus TaxID=8267 RepID=UPI00148DFBFF|nr:keratin-associated protein 4-7 [Hippoglossus hippoglossus]